MSRGCRSLVVLLAVVFTLVAFIGCQSSPPTSPEATETAPLLGVASSDWSIGRRLQAAERLDLNQDDAWMAVAESAWSTREPSRLRIALLKKLHEADADQFWTRATRHWPIERNSTVDDFLRDTSRNAGEKAAAAVLLRWAAVQPAGASTQRAMASDWLLAQNADETNEGAAHEQLLEWLNSPKPWAWRVAAWRVMCGWADRASIEHRLRSSVHHRDVSPFVADLRATIDVLGEWPTRGWELYALRQIRSRPGVDGQTAWGHFAKRSQKLTPSTRRDTAMRHTAWLISQPHVNSVGHSSVAFIVDTTAREVNRNAIDAAIVRWLQEQLGNLALRSTLFVQADADHADTQSEHGGLVVLNHAGQAIFKPYLPIERRHDRAYVAPVSLSMDLGSAVATYHFHAERYANAPHAGPGFGDRRAVERSATLMVVFTFLDQDTLAVHVAAPGDQLFDLGVIRRP
ncbi:MAG: hypothetical protein AAF328_09515 [Planctomycetota bacterium]